MPENSNRTRHPNNGVAAVGIGIGVAYLMIGVLLDQLISGLVGLGIMVVYIGLLYGLRRRSETAELLSSNPSDERQQQVMLRATTFTGQVLVTVIVAGMLVSMLLDSTYTPVFTALAGVGGFSFIGATAWFSHRT